MYKPDLRKLSNILSPPEYKKFRLLDRLLSRQFDQSQLDSVRQAFDYGRTAHLNSYRASGDPYITHPLEVAILLADMKMDCATVVAAILHDVIEDTEIVTGEIEEKFGSEIANMVDGLSKLDHFNFASASEARLANYSKMFIAMARDIRLVFIKLADRLHNMRTISYVAQDKQQRIARETKILYIPLASRVGMHKIQQEMENICFRVLHPFRYRVLSSKLNAAANKANRLYQLVAKQINEQLELRHINADIKTRTKSVYSCHEKMQDKRLRFSEIDDILAMRIIVENTDECYRTLGVVHNHYTPFPGKFRDYIGATKFNGYQSLHTTVRVDPRNRLEVQIRTPEMDRFSEVGLASHWTYKANSEVKKKAIAQANAWISSLTTFDQPNSGESTNMMLKLSPETETEIYVFSKDKDTICLPEGATALDFAFAIHTDIGLRSLRAQIDGQTMPLHTPLESGQTIAIVHDKKKAVSDPARLNYVRTHKARSAILNSLSQLKPEQVISIGHDLLAKSLCEYNLSLKQEKVQQALLSFIHSCGYPDQDTLYREIGLGNRLVQLIARGLADTIGRDQNMSLFNKTVTSIKGMEGINHQLALCCQPIPADEIIGVQTRGQGLVIHRVKCKNLAKFRTSHPELLIPLEWTTNAKNKLFQVTITVSAINKKGALARISTAIADMNVNIVKVVLRERSRDNVVVIPFTIELNHRNTLARVIRSLRRINLVQHVSRLTP